MGLEIERKFLVTGDTWRESAVSAVRIVQGYLANSDTSTVRVRVKGEHAYLTIKGATSGISRSEYEYEIPVDDALAMLADLVVGGVIDKIRHIVPVAGRDWEIDVFAGENTGLVLAEIELASADDVVEPPEWAGPDVSHDARYYNVFLASRPYSTW